jgi:hypothetical protein
VAPGDPPRAGGHAGRQRVFIEAPGRGVVRRRITEEQVRLMDAAGDERTREILLLARGDEVELLARHGTFLWVRTPTGEVGWVPDTAMSGEQPGRRRR